MGKLVNTAEMGKMGEIIETLSNRFAAGSRFCLILLFAVSLTACGGSRTVVTQDDSADYHSARSLPPLKKPSPQRTASPAPAPQSTAPAPAAPVQAVEQSVEQPIESAIEPSIDQSAAESPVAQAPEFEPLNEPVVEPFGEPDGEPDGEPFGEPSEDESSVVDLPEAVDNEPAEQLVLEDVSAPDDTEFLEADTQESEYQETDVPTAAPEPVVEVPEVAADEVLSARVIQPRDDVARLQIDGGFDAAWNYLSANLRNSDITVHNRNRTAGRFAIGCGNLEESTTVTRRGGWSIFTRKPKKQEHCSMQLLTSRSVTVVTLNNRSGVEIAADSAKEVFTRLLNN